MKGQLSGRERSQLEAVHWRGPLRHYDILKEATIAVGIVLVLVLLLSWVFSSPDQPPVTLRQWAQAQPTGFSQTALSELAGTSDSAQYGPPYNSGSQETQSLGPISPERLFGVRIPVNSAQAFVLRPLASLPATPKLRAALRSWAAASRAQRRRWVAAEQRALSGRRLASALPRSAPGAGPLPELLGQLLSMARSGALDAQLVAQGNFYTTNYTKPLLFLGDSWKAQKSKSYWGELVTAGHLRSSQWGVMNETGSWPGQPWLWLYTMWYQLPTNAPLSTSPNGDIAVLAIMSVLSLALLLVPFIPVLRDLPRWIPLHRWIWRRYYRQAKAEAGGRGSR